MSTIFRVPFVPGCIRTSNTALPLIAFRGFTEFRLIQFGPIVTGIGVNSIDFPNNKKSKNSFMIFSLDSYCFAKHF